MDTHKFDLCMEEINTKSVLLVNYYYFPWRIRDVGGGGLLTQSWRHSLHPNICNFRL